jgi:hypothetical protein
VSWLGRRPLVGHPRGMAEEDGTTSRSYAAHAVGQQLYAVVEFCSSAETLYGKIESGHWDWLGVAEKGRKKTFILGRPSRARRGFDARGGGGPVAAGAESGRHGVEVREPHPTFKAPGTSWWATPEDAEIDYERQIKRLREGPGSAVYKVGLVLDGVTVRTEIVVRALPNRL